MSTRISKSSITSKINRFGESSLQAAAYASHWTLVIITRSVYSNKCLVSYPLSHSMDASVASFWRTLPQSRNAGVSSVRSTSQRQR
ncbi:hypothetical protein M413DRAFT_442181 [Hebeloma cylindrosporum]|uniref:Uncharacterized protein n=1 Tax=Hebeloma cylindrosporum TaxID=76867 RepID=A0A0C3CN14_HEBCY|nr:hypothetical protein M413DRAFT_442181 [Hebeloma cylindrosporum h7]